MKFAILNRRVFVIQHFFEEIDHEIFSMSILFLPLIQQGQLSVSDDRIRTSTAGKPLRELIFPRKGVLR